MLEDFKSNGGPALHIMNDFQDPVPLKQSAAIQSSTFGSALYPMNRRYRLQRGFKIGAVGYSVDSK